MGRSCDCAVVRPGEAAWGLVVPSWGIPREEFFGRYQNSISVFFCWMLQDGLVTIVEHNRDVKQPTRPRLEGTTRVATATVSRSCIDTDAKSHEARHSPLLPEICSCVLCVETTNNAPRVP
jgi:hypothetical protein